MGRYIRTVPSEAILTMQSMYKGGRVIATTFACQFSLALNTQSSLQLGSNPDFGDFKKCSDRQRSSVSSAASAQGYV